jgi:hypothetical protein
MSAATAEVFHSGKIARWTPGCVCKGEGDAGRDCHHTTDSQRDPQAPIHLPRGGGVLGELPGLRSRGVAVRVCSIPRRQLLGLPRGFWLDTAAALFAAGLDALVNWLATGRLTEV